MTRWFVAAVLLLGLANPAQAGWLEGVAAYERGEYRTAFREWLPLAEQGDSSAQAFLGYFYFHGRGVTQDYEQAAKWTRRAAEQGNAGAQYNLGFMYWQGRGVPQDHGEAAMWSRRAAEQGHADARGLLSLLYEQGQGVPQDYAEAVKWRRLAAEQGLVAAQVDLGFMYYRGNGVPQDYAEAAKWYRQAAEQGNDEAQLRLSIQYYFGQGILQDYGEAARWASRAAEQGNARAQFSLGYSYSQGHGVPQDHVNAYLWFNLAASRLPPGEYRDNAIISRDVIAKSLTPERLALAKDMARNWRPKSEQQAAQAMIPKTDESPGSWPAVPALPRASQFEVIEIQTALASLGYDPGPADGIVGSRTRTAIRAYQAALGFGVDGEVSDALLVSLRTALALAGTAVARPEEKGPELYASGTGFVISRAGHVLTNQHVVADCTLVRVPGSDGEGAAATVAAVDGENDLAVLVVPADIDAVAKFRGGRGVRPGDAVVAVGFPLQGLLASSANVTTGTVSALAGIRDDIRYLQITAPTQPGNSGGPLLDMSGNVVGVVVAKLDALKVAELTGDIPQNVNFAIKDSVARSFLDARGVEYETAPSDQDLTAAEVGERAAAFTVLVECWK